MQWLLYWSDFLFWWAFFQILNILIWIHSQTNRQKKYYLKVFRETSFSRIFSLFRALRSCASLLRAWQTYPTLGRLYAAANTTCDRKCSFVILIHFLRHLDDVAASQDDEKYPIFIYEIFYTASFSSDFIVEKQDCYLKAHR